MIIDSHAHLVGDGWLSPDIVNGIGKSIAAIVGKETGEYPDSQATGKGYLQSCFDTTGERLIASMDTAGVNKSCIFATDFGLAGGEPPVPIEEQNRIIAAVVKSFPERLIPFFSIDPRRGEGLDMFKRAVEDWDMRGLKFHPTSGFCPFDPIVYPFYRKCLEYDVPVIFHQGTIPAPLKTRFAQPLYLDDVAADFPDLNIIMAHVAKPMWQEALTVAAVKPNIYLDISGWQSDTPEDTYRMLRCVLDTVGPWRVFFGSDSPYHDSVCTLDRWVSMLTKPDLSSCPGITFSPEEIDVIMGPAFARLLKSG